MCYRKRTEKSSLHPRRRRRRHVCNRIRLGNAAQNERTSNRWVVLVIACLAQFMVMLDATIVNVALPSIQRGLHFSGL